MADGVARRFLDALAARDYEALAACFAPDAKLRALVPSRIREEAGPQAIAERFRVWIGELESYRLTDHELEEVADRVHVHYRFEGLDPEDGIGLMDQHGYLVLEDGRISALNLVCSGFRAR